MGTCAIGVPHGSVFGQKLYCMFTKLIGEKYAADTTYLSIAMPITRMST